MHPVENIRGTASSHLAGRRIVLAVCGSIAAVKAVELARELVRHGAHVQCVMSAAATQIVHPDALEFATGNPVVARLSGQVEHVAWLGDVPGRADLLLVAPATANTVAKIALGIDDTPVTTCATVAMGTRVPIVVAPAMHEAMLDHPVVAQHTKALARLGVAWVEPRREEKKAKLADVEAIVEAVIHALANRPGGGPLAGRRCLVVGGATAEPLDAVRVVTNRSSGRSAILLARALRRLGARVDLWYGHGTEALPSDLDAATTRYATHGDLMRRVRALKVPYDQVWMPAAIGDFAPEPAAGKVPSGKAFDVRMVPIAKVILALRRRLPRAVLVAFKAESEARGLEAAAKDRLRRYNAQFVCANLADAMGADATVVTLHGADGSRERHEGPKQQVMEALAASVARRAPGPTRKAPAPLKAARSLRARAPAQRPARARRRP